MENYWKVDTATKRFREEHAPKLANPARMTTKLLAEAVRRCKTTDNPFSYELMRRTRRAN